MLGSEGEIGEGDAGLQFIFQEVRRYLLLIHWTRSSVLLKFAAKHREFGCGLLTIGHPRLRSVTPG
jgi:hypothetical protein